MTSWTMPGTAPPERTPPLYFQQLLGQPRGSARAGSS